MIIKELRNEILKLWLTPLKKGTSDDVAGAIRGKKMHFDSLVSMPLNGGTMLLEIRGRTI